MAAPIARIERVKQATGAGPDTTLPEDFDLSAEMEARQFWPNVFYVNDHGNVSLLDSEGNSHGSWV